MQDREASCRHSTLRKAQGAGGVTGSTMNTECTGKSTNYTEIHVLRNIYSTWPTLRQVLPSYKSYRSYKSYFSAHSIGFAQCAMHMVKALHMEHGGKPHFSPREPPFRPGVIWRPAARDAFLRLPRSPRRLRQRGGLNARWRHGAAAMWSAVGLTPSRASRLRSAPAWQARY